MLITTRRLFAVLLLPMFLVLFVATLTVFRVNATLLEADFYTDTFERLGVYEFLYADALPFAIEESGVDLAALPLGLDLTPDGVAGYVARVLPPEWLAENLGGAIAQAVPYLTGETDSFEITLRLDDRVEAADVVVRDLLRDARIHAYLLDEVVRPRLDESKETLFAGLPFNPGLTTDQILDGVKDVVPEEWLKQRIEDVLDQVVPYAVGKTDSFAVHIPLQERADVGLGVVAVWLNLSLEGGGAYDYLLEEQIAPVVRANLGSAVALPYGVEVTDAEILDAMSQVLPPDWVQERVTDAIAAFGPYLTGRTDSFVLSIPLQDRAVLAADVLVDAVDAKLEAVYTALPICTLEQLGDVVSSLSLTELPECRPAPISYAALKSIVNLNVVDELAAAIVDQLPDAIEVTERSLLDAFGDAPGGVSVDVVRGYLRDGYTFTDGDLVGLFENFDAGDTDFAARLDEYRGYLRDGITFDDSSLAAELGDNIELFDDVRGWVDLGRSLLFLLIVLLGFIALIVGFLGGRRWGTRLAWAGVPVLISGALIGGIFSAASGPLRAFSDDPIRDLDVTPVLIDKLLDVRDDLVASFVDPIATQGLVTAALGFVMIVAGSFWASRRRVTFAPATAAPTSPLAAEHAGAAGRAVDEAAEEPPAEEPPEASPEEPAGVEETPHEEAEAKDASEEQEEEGPAKPSAGA
ncbi:MAG: hypothetical protein IIC32_04935 [Chloroflexi bacterium]|nr:hypothetical protein [Chloroflexota bacterium]